MPRNANVLGSRKELPNNYALAQFLPEHSPIHFLALHKQEILPSLKTVTRSGTFVLFIARYLPKKFVLRPAVNASRQKHFQTATWINEPAAFAHLFINITKDQIKRLTPEQQETLASIEVQHTKTRGRLLKQVGNYRAMSWFPALVVVALYLAPVLITNPKYVQTLVICVGMSLWLLIHFHSAADILSKAPFRLPAL